MTASPGVRLAALVVAVLVLQLSIASRAELAGARPDLLAVLAVAAGLVLGPERGAVVGFAAGLLEDLFLTTPLGLTALVWGVAAWGVGTVVTTVAHPTRLTSVLLAAAASLSATLAFAVVGALLGQEQLLTGRLPAIALVEAVVTAALVLPAARAVRWADADAARSGAGAR